MRPWFYYYCLFFFGLSCLILFSVYLLRGQASCLNLFTTTDSVRKWKCELFISMELYNLDVFLWLQNLFVAHYINFCTALIQILLQRVHLTVGRPWAFILQGVDKDLDLLENLMKISIVCYLVVSISIVIKAFWRFYYSVILFKMSSIYRSNMVKTSIWIFRHLL